MEKMTESNIREKYGKNIRVSFRISPRAKDRLDQVADLFQIEPSQCAKSILYMHLGIFEPVDNRRRSWRQSRKKRRRILVYEKDQET